MTFEIETIETYGIQTALRALRRPMNRKPAKNTEPLDTDMRLMLELVKKGDDHAKFARMIGVGFTVKAPRYWWIEFATYRAGIESVSESTMHRKMSEPFTEDDFEDGIFIDCLEDINARRKDYLNGYWTLYSLKGMIPESYLQTRDIVANYQALRHIYHARKGHKLPHWQVFREWMETLPYSQLITVGA
jgi:hypothetical protein